nr:MAG TPA: hypothetical protein [Caudoviricetes sp.]
MRRFVLPFVCLHKRQHPSGHGRIGGVRAEKAVVKVIVVYFPEVFAVLNAYFAEVMLAVRVVFGAKIPEFLHRLHNFRAQFRAFGAHAGRENQQPADEPYSQVVVQFSYFRGFGIHCFILISCFFFKHTKPETNP